MQLYWFIQHAKILMPGSDFGISFKALTKHLFKLTWVYLLIWTCEIV